MLKFASRLLLPSGKLQRKSCSALYSCRISCTPPSPTTTHHRYTSSHRRPWSCPKLALYTRIYLWEENKANRCGLYFPVGIFAEILGFGGAEVSATIQESYVALAGEKRACWRWLLPHGPASMLQEGFGCITGIC